MPDDKQKSAVSLDTATRAILSRIPERHLRLGIAIDVHEGPDAGLGFTSHDRVITIGTSENNHFVLRDQTVSRYHLRIEILQEGYVLTDLESTNGTYVQKMKIMQVLVEGHGSIHLRLGDTHLRLSSAAAKEIALSKHVQFGAVIGVSSKMRELFRVLEHVSPKLSTVLLDGETGTGKELLAEEIHRHSSRSERPFMIVDCSAIPPALIESELFGHTQGAFTGALSSRPGAFEAADGGTLFLDEVGELDLSVQPRFLRALERGQIKRIGENNHRKVDVRIIAATNRDLQKEVNLNTFRADLFYRLAVVHLRIPPLRERPEDIEVLVQSFIPNLAERLGVEAANISPETLQMLIAHTWPGNVRELRNLIERLMISSSNTADGSIETLDVLPRRMNPSETMFDQEALNDLPFHDAKSTCLERFEHNYLTHLLQVCDHNVSESARRSGIARGYLFRLLKKHQLR